MDLRNARVPGSVLRFGCGSWTGRSPTAHCAVLPPVIGGGSGQKDSFDCLVVCPFLWHVHGRSGGLSTACLGPSKSHVVSTFQFQQTRPPRHHPAALLHVVALPSVATRGCFKICILGATDAGSCKSLQVRTRQPIPSPKKWSDLGAEDRLRQERKCRSRFTQTIAT